MPIGFNMGTEGAAIATVIGQIVAFILAAFINHRKNADIRLDLKKFRPQKHLISRIYAIGLPSVIMMAIGSVMTWLMNIILINYTVGKETAATVFGAYFKLNSFAFMPVFGLNNGVIPIIAYNYGAQKRSRMTKAIRVSLALASAFMLLGTVLFLLIPDVLLGFFNASETMLAIGEPALRIIASTFVVAGVCIVLGSVFQALGYSVYSMIVSLARQLIVLVPVAWALATIGRNIGNDNLVWIAFPRGGNRVRSRYSRAVHPPEQEGDQSNSGSRLSPHLFAPPRFSARRGGFCNPPQRPCGAFTAMRKPPFSAGAGIFVTPHSGHAARTQRCGNPFSRKARGFCNPPQRPCGAFTAMRKPPFPAGAGV